MTYRKGEQKMGRGKATKTIKIENALVEVLTDRHPMTVRQAYYQLVARHTIANNQSQYDRISRILVDMRQAGKVDWSWIEDRNRRPRTVYMWDSLEDFAGTAVQAYRRNLWEQQNTLIEVWLEKDALSGIFEEVLAPYGVTLNVGRGYDGWASIQAAAERYLSTGKPALILYFGDFDPSGMDMLRSLKERLQYFHATPTIHKCAITKRDIKDFNLPPDLAKITDPRHDNFVDKWGNSCVELDALPVDVLEDRIRTNIEGLMDMEALSAVIEEENLERVQLMAMIQAAGL